MKPLTLLLFSYLLYFLPNTQAMPFFKNRKEQTTTAEVNNYDQTVTISEITLYQGSAIKQDNQNTYIASTQYNFIGKITATDSEHRTSKKQGTFSCDYKLNNPTKNMQSLAGKNHIPDILADEFKRTLSTPENIETPSNYLLNFNGTSFPPTDNDKSSVQKTSDWSSPLMGYFMIHIAMNPENRSTSELTLPPCHKVKDGTSRAILYTDHP